MSRVRISFGIVLVALMVGLGGLIAPNQASAAGAAPTAVLSVDVHCEATGGGTFLCDAFRSGGVAPYTYTWTPSSNATITQNLGITVYGRCVIGTIPSMRVTVRDSRGAVATDTTSFRCTTVAP